MSRLTIEVRINGTAVNPWHSLGLTQNPFPSLGKIEYDRGCLRLQGLDGDPVPDTGYIRAYLKGYVSDEMIELCCKQFKKGERVQFKVSFKE